MKRLLQSLFGVILLCGSMLQASVCVPCRNPKSIFLPRSQGRNAAREIAGWQPYIHRCGFDDTYGIFSITPAYTQSFDPDTITDYLFGQAAKDGKVTFSGSRFGAATQSASPHRGQFDIVADYFGLPRNFKSEICFTPRIRNFLMEFNWYLGLDRWKEGAYFRILMPIVHSRWSLNPCEKIIDKGSDVGGNGAAVAFPNGYMDKLGIPRDQLPSSILDSWASCNGVVWGDMQDRLKHGKLFCGTETKSRLADLTMALGWNWVNHEEAHAGFNIRATFPTGNKPHAEFLFEPIAGNGGHFELGAGYSSHARLYYNNATDASINVYFDCNITHIFEANSLRSFDFIQNGPGSRYMLLAEFEAIPQRVNPADPLSVDVGHLTNQITHEYAERLLPAINLTTLCCKVKANLQADMALKFAFTKNDFTFDIGYNLWARSREKIRLIDSIKKRTFGIKGDAYIFGALGPNADDAQGAYENCPAITNPGANNATAPTGFAVPLSATQDTLATFYVGGNHTPGINSNEGFNPGIDFPARAEAANAAATELFVFSPVAGVGENSGLPADVPILTSSPPLFIDETKLDLDSAASPAQMTHKVFVDFAFHLSVDEDKSIRFPFIAFGGEVEWEQEKEYFGKSPCECETGLNQWGVWLKGGFEF